MIKTIIFATFIGFCSVSFAQQNEVIEVTESEITKGDVPFAVIEEVPVYPGCKGSNNAELKDCMSAEISKFVSKHFDMKKIQSLNLPPKRYRTAVQFKIDKNGNVTDVHARAEHPDIETEAVRVVSNLPQMKAGKQKGENVGVLYSLPILFIIEPPSKKELKKSKKKL
jgi:protein TonB